MNGRYNKTLNGRNWNDYHINSERKVYKIRNNPENKNEEQGIFKDKRMIFIRNQQARNDMEIKNDKFGRASDLNVMKSYNSGIYLQQVKNKTIFEKERSNLIGGVTNLETAFKQKSELEEINPKNMTNFNESEILKANDKYKTKVYKKLEDLYDKSKIPGILKVKRSECVYNEKNYFLFYHINKKE